LENKIEEAIKEIDAQKELFQSRLDQNQRLLKDEIGDSLKPITEESKRAKDELRDKIEGLAKEFDSQKKVLQSIVAEDSAQMDVFKKALREIRTQVIAFSSNKPKYQNRWEDDIGKIETELRQMNNEMLEQYKIAQEIKKGIEETKVI